MPVKSSSHMKIGLYLPNGAGYMAGGVHTWADVLTMARAAESSGFDSLWVADHMLFRFDGRAETQGRWEAWSLLAALAAATTKVALGPLVSCMSFRNPALLAKIAETVDEISGGRLILAVGAGWHEPEYTAYGFPFDHRASRFEEGFTVLRELLKDGRSEFNGEYVSVSDCEVVPRGPRPGGIPLIAGTNGPRLLRFAAAHADGWNTDWIGSPAALKPLLDAVDAACAGAGRDPATFSRSACIFIDLPDARGRFPHSDERQPGAMSMEAVLGQLRAYADLGLDHVMVWLDPYTTESVSRFEEVLQRFRQA